MVNLQSIKFNASHRAACIMGRARARHTLSDRERLALMRGERVDTPLTDEERESLNRLHRITQACDTVAKFAAENAV